MLYEHTGTLNVLMCADSITSIYIIYIFFLIRCHMSGVTGEVSSFRCHLLRVTCHMSPVTCMGDIPLSAYCA